MDMEYVKNGISGQNRYVVKNNKVRYDKKIFCFSLVFT